MEKFSEILDVQQKTKSNIEKFWNNLGKTEEGQIPKLLAVEKKIENWWDSLSKDSGNETEAKHARELSDDEKKHYGSVLEWTDGQLNKCTINEDGTLNYKTDNCHMEGMSAENGVRYERKSIEINGIRIFGVFPVFESKFDVYLPKDFEKESNNKQFKMCNEQLKDSIEGDRKLAKEFTNTQRMQIKTGDTPEGYVWHHNEEPGKMQLVKVSDHDRTQGGAAHTGGKSLWGGGY